MLKTALILLLCGLVILGWVAAIAYAKGCLVRAENERLRAALRRRVLKDWKPRAEIRAQERERCAKIADAYADEYCDQTARVPNWCAARRYGAQEVAARLRRVIPRVTP